MNPIVQWFLKRKVVKMLDGVRERLSGIKTYLVTVGAIVTAFAAWIGGDLTTEKLVALVFAAVTAMTMRAGIKKSEPK